MSAAAASQRPSAEAEEISSWQGFKEWLLPSVTFERSSTAKKDLAFARIVLAIFYAGLAGVFIYTVIRLCYSGRIELFSNMYKVDFVQAPSLAFCPFNANDTLQWPDGTEPWATATKDDLTNGSVTSHVLTVTPRNCSFDRNCGCVDMGEYSLSDTSRTTHPRGAKHEMVFRESIEIRTNFSDPSPERVLKVGIYDSYDSAPDWFYVNQGSMFIGQLELIIWTVVDVSIQGLVNTLKGDLRAMVKNRHIYRYTSQSVGSSRQHQSWRETSVRYEMKTFFVEETVSSHRALSWYTVGVLLALVALRWVVVDAFFMATMPEYQEKKDTPVFRELTGTSVWIRNLFCCCLDDTGERDPLLSEGKSQA
jgi:hypothetical protein